MAQTLSSRLFSLLRRLLSVFLKAGLKPFQVLLHAVYRRLSALHLALTRLLRCGGDRPGGESKEGETVRGAPGVIKVLNGKVVSLSGVQRSSFPHGRSIDGRSAEDAHEMAVTLSQNKSRTSSLNSAAGLREEYAISTQQQSPTITDRPFSLAQAIESQTPLKSSRSNSPPSDVVRPQSRLRPSLRSRQEGLPLGHDGDIEHAYSDGILDPPPRVTDYDAGPPPPSGNRCGRYYHCCTIHQPPNHAKH